MIDIKVDDDWQLTRAANGDAPVTASSEEFLQSIKLESMTQEGDLFYDLEYGWSLLDFLHTTESELTRTAIESRVRSKMGRREEIDITTLEVSTEFKNDLLYIDIRFKRYDSDNSYFLTIALDRIRVEVIIE